MSQQINLINPSLIKKKDFLTFVNIGLVYGAFCALILGWVAYTDMQVSELNKKQSGLAGELVQLQTSLDQMTAARAPHEPDLSLRTQVEKLEAVEQVQTQILMVIDQNKQQTMSLANYMRGLAKQTMDGLWLTGFTIDQVSHAITLRGRSLSADVLPLYMKKLGSEPVFNGQLFGGLQIQQPAQTPDVSAVESDKALGTVLPQYVEFELQGLEVKPDQLVVNNVRQKANS